MGVLSRLRGAANAQYTQLLCNHRTPLRFFSPFAPFFDWRLDYDHGDPVTSAFISLHFGGPQDGRGYEAISFNSGVSRDGTGHRASSLFSETHAPFTFSVDGKGWNAILFLPTTVGVKNPFHFAIFTVSTMDLQHFAPSLSNLSNHCGVWALPICGTESISSTLLSVTINGCLTFTPTLIIVIVPMVSISTLLFTITQETEDHTLPVLRFKGCMLPLED